MSTIGTALKVLSIAAVGLFAVACERAPEQAKPKPKQEKPAPALALAAVTFGDVPGWGSDRLAEVYPAIERSCRRISNASPDRQIGTKAVPMAAKDWTLACSAVMKAGANGDLAALFESHFTPFLASNNGEEAGLITGYFEAELKGATEQGGAFQHPIYKRPDDHVIADLGIFDPSLKGKQVIGRVEGGRFIPYPERSALEGSHLPGNGLELFWAADRIDVFLLQVQGSGRVILPDGSVRRIGFDGHNGRPYKSIGRALIDSGDLKPHQASWDGIRGWIDRNPDQANALLAKNPRFIFFREIKGEGPIGAEGLPLTPRRSLAVDRRFVPLGVPLWLDTNWPLEPDRPLRQLMVAQDTGGAIKGPVRGDFFWGYGAKALKHAGRMKSKGRYYLFLPNNIAERIQKSS